MVQARLSRPAEPDAVNPQPKCGPSQTFLVHRIAGAANVAGLENPTNLDQLPATGA